MSSPGRKTKREDVLDWQDYFMGTAFLAGKRSKDPNCQVGACIVNKDKVIVGVGYNGMPRGCSDDVFPWDKWGDTPLDTKKLYVCHAEMNAIMNKNMSDVRDCTLYVTRFPCNECAKMIIQAGIKEVFYLNMEGQELKVQASERMFRYAGIHYEQYKPKCNKIVIDFTERRSEEPLNITLCQMNLDNQNK